MRLGTRFYGAACLLMITIASLAEGGAFEPDNVVRVDTVTVHMTNVVMVDTVYVEADVTGAAVTTVRKISGGQFLLMMLGVAGLIVAMMVNSPGGNKHTAI